MKKTYLTAFAALSLVASPALGMTKPPVIPPNPVTVEMQQGLTRDFNAAITCIGTRLFDARAKDQAVVRLEAANQAAGWAAAYRDLATWNTEAAKLRAELPGIRTTYGCN